MSWALEIAVKYAADEMAKAGIKVNIPGSILITPESAMPLQRGLSIDKYNKIIRDAIVAEQQRRKAKQLAKQSTLFD